MKKVFVTGGTGFTGSYLCRALAEQKYDVTALVREGKEIKDLEKLGVKKYMVTLQIRILLKGN